MPRKLLAGCIAIALSSIPVAALAARAYTVSGAQIFAGPGGDYPIVAQLRQGSQVNVNGCLSDYTWCDVSLGANRGWVDAQDLAYSYRSHRVLIPEYGPQLGLPLITFSLGNYWDHYYRGRPFYNQRAQWEQNARDHDRGRDHAQWEQNARNHDHADYRGEERNNGYRANEMRDRQNVRNGQDTRAQDGAYRTEQRRQDPNVRNEHGATQHETNQERANQQRSNQSRGEARAADRGTMPDLPAGGEQGVSPGDHSRYQQ